MERIAIIGNGGGGKTAAALRLSEALGLPLLEIDAIQWKPGWVATPPEEVSREHALWMERGRWIIDGFGPWPCVEERFARADAVLFVDFPLWRHYWWANKRQVRALFLPRVGGPEGCPLPAIWWRMMKTISRVHRDLRPKILASLESLPPEKAHRLRSPAELKAFLARHCSLP